MSRVSPQDALAFAQRWKLVRDMAATERQSTPIEIRFRQLSALMASRDLFGAEPDRAASAAAVRDRWSRLRQVANA
jgi:hypothetical protein